jgi:hypothetical protein
MVTALMNWACACGMALVNVRFWDGSARMPPRMTK